jgi:nucleoside-diphosphate-sugar epimerase
MKILITGAGGFVGKNLLEGLSSRYEIFAPRSKELDLTDFRAVEQYLKRNSINIVVHAAVHSALAVSREEGFQTDLRMLVNLTRNLDLLDRLIVFGSGAEYSKNRDMKKVSETELGQSMPDDLYGLAKFLTNEIVRREPKMVNLRLFGVYGPYEDYRHKFISNAIVKNLLRMPIKIKQDVIFDYLYVTDLVPIVEYFINHQTKHRDYNVSTTKSIKLSEIAEIINQVAEEKSEITIVNPEYNYQYTGDNTRLRQEIPEWTIVGYRAGIKKLYDYYREIISNLDREGIENDAYFKKTNIK